MTKEQAKQRIEKLKKVISHHRYLYHVLNRQEISDAALDSLKHELYQLEQNFPEFITPDSPTQRVAGGPLEGFIKVKHEVPMLSIEDVFSEKELLDWENYLKRLQPSLYPFEYFAELKIDGFAITLIYEAGILKCGATRGDGRVGEDVTQNLKTIESIPLKLRECQYLASSLKRIEIRGEVYMAKKAFEKVNQERKKKGEPLYANPRNLAAGSIRQLDPKLAASRPLEFLAYDLVTDLGQKTHPEEHQILKALGFKTDSHAKICQNLKEVIGLWRKIAKKRAILPHLIDGVVVIVNDNNLFDKLGVVGKSPRGMRAFKFSPKQATTILKDIKLQVGRTGAITPVAYLKPVEVGGVTVSRATLHNEEEIKRLGVKIGDTVIVGRAGDVIPEVIKVLPKLRTGQEKKFQMPKVCPVCGRKLIKPVGEVVWRCENKDCAARRREFLYHFTSKKAFAIEGLGPKIIDQLMDENLISRAPDIFELKEGDLLPLERFGVRSAQNLVEAIQKSKKITLARFIYSLGIRHTGEETAIDLARYFGSIDKLKKASREELEKIPDIGEKVSESIYNWFQQEINQKLIDDFLKARVEILPPEIVGKKLQGFTFVITGTLESMSRTEAEKEIRLQGGHPTNSVSKQTDYLIVGREPGSSKLERAKELRVKTIE
jgi:DNA ligase (NAD+)